MANPELIKTFEAEGDVASYRLVAPGSTDHSVIQAAGTTALIQGASMELGKEANGRVDVSMAGLPEVTYGGTITRGDPLTSDADGKAVKATVAGSRIAGFALVSGVAGDIVPFQHAPGYLP